MNTIYKVIWSKAKNCYVVASEIARSHTKSATGSEKMGGYGKRALLALAVATAIVCGGFVNVGATVQSVTISSTTTTTDNVLTGEASDVTQINEVIAKADKLVTSDKFEGADGIDAKIEKNKNDIGTLDATINDASTGLVKKVSDNTTAINDLAGIVGDSKSDGLVKDNAQNKADIGDLQTKTSNLSDDGTTLTGMTTVSGTNVNATDLKVTGTITDGVNTTKLADIKNSMTQTETNKTDIGNLKKTTGEQDTAIKDLQKKTTQISYDDGRGTSISGIDIKDGNIVGNGNSAITGITNIETGNINGKSLAGTTVATVKEVTDAVESEKTDRENADKDLSDRIGSLTEDKNYIKKDKNVSDNLVELDKQAKTNADAIAQEKTDRENAIGSLTEDKNYIKKDKNVSDNLVELDKQAKTNADAIAQEKTDRENAIGSLTEDKNYIKKDKNVSDNLVELDKQAKTNADAIAQEKTDRENAIGSLTEDKNYIKKDKNVSDNLVELDKQAKQNADDIKDTNQRTAGITRDDTRDETRIEGKVTVDTNGNITAEGTITSKGLDAGAGDIKTTGKVSAGDVSTGTLETTGDATIGGNLDVNGTLKTKDVTAETIHVSKTEDTTDYKSEGSIIGDGGKLSVSNEKTDKRTNITKKSELNVNEEGTVNWATSTDNATGNVTEGRSEVTADNIKNSVKKTEGGKTFGYEENITADGKVGTVTDKDGNTSSTRQDSTVIRDFVKDKDGNKSYSQQESDRIAESVIGKDGKQTHSEMTSTDITNTAKDGTITNDAKDIVNKASGDMTNTVGGNLKNEVTGNIENSATNITNTATGDMTNTIGGKLTTTVTGAAKEEYKGGLTTDVTGEENHTVTGNQNNKVTGKQTNTVEGGQENIISGGQKNNILTGNQETTVSEGSIINKAENGNISNTAKNVTNEGTESVTNKVGTNEVTVSQDGVDIKVDADKTIKESVGADTSRTMIDGKIIDKAGDMTVTTDKTTGTTFGNGTVNDTTVINGGTIGTNNVNANQTNTKKLTAGADDGVDGGRLTVDATGGVNGSYKFGDYTSKSYILKNTLKSGVDNGKEPTEADFVGSRTDHSMDGDKAKLDETVKDAAGSNVTNKTSTGTSTTITDASGNTTSSTMTSTDITNEAKNSITDTVGTASRKTEDGKITDTAGDSTVTTENNKGTIFGKKGSTDTTTIYGDSITTGKATMDYADVMKDLGVRGNTTLGEAGKDTTLTVNSKSTFNAKATFEQGAEVKNGLKVTSGGMEVTGASTFHDDVTMDKNLTVGGNVDAGSFTVKGTDIKIDQDGINAGGLPITNVGDGSIAPGSKDVVNGGQLHNVKTELEGKVNKVGANAAAMANLHPMEFDPDSKWNIAAAMGNYGSETATAMGLFYRPNEDVMVNLSTAFGTGENMVGGGVSVRLGQGGNKLTRKENNELKAQVNDLTARMDALLSVLNPNMSKDFPDVPENHWAYEAVSRLAGNDIVQGYPDGEFHGERTMTRYEMAEIIYKALSRGAEAEKKLVDEFKPELQAMAASNKATAEAPAPASEAE